MTSSPIPQRNPTAHRVRCEARIARRRGGGARTRPLPPPAPAAPRGPGLAALAVTLLVLTGHAQEMERYGERLSRMPVDLRTTSAISGAGAVSAELRGDELTIRIRFDGLSGGVTAAHVHNAPAARRGGVAFAIDLGGATGAAGEIVDTLTLTADQLVELRAERYYVQLHTESNPGGELRGWLLRRVD